MKTDSLVEIKNILLDHCATNKQAYRIETMSSKELADSFIHNVEAGLIDLDLENARDLYSLALELLDAA